MDKYIEILKQIENAGYNAYIVGGFVRDKILGHNTKDADIVTNAKIEELKDIFGENLKAYPKYGAAKLKIKNEIIDITTMRKELSYVKGKPSNILYTDSLEEDLIRRDFTINTICIDKEENIIDLLNAIKDIKGKLIKTVRDVNIEIMEDPSRIIRALRFMSELNFELDFSLKRYIVENKDLIRNITSNKIKEELDKLFKSNNVTKFLDFIKLYNIDNTLGICFNKFVETGTIIGAWSQFELTREYPFTKKEKQNIKVLKCLIKQGKITKMDVYKNEQYLSQIAAKILGIDENKINLMYTCLPIKSIIDIDIESDKISEILNLEKGKKIGEILNILESEIIEGTLKNNRVEIIKRLKEIR